MRRSSRSPIGTVGTRRPTTSLSSSPPAADLSGSQRPLVQRRRRPDQCRVRSRRPSTPNRCRCRVWLRPEGEHLLPQERHRACITDGDDHRAGRAAAVVLYRLEPTAPIEDGRKIVSFEPPQEVLTGERLHQWIGARFAVDGPAVRLPDLDRIERQKVLVRRLLEERVRFASPIEDTADVSSWNGRTAFADLAQIGPTWRLETSNDVEPAEIDGKRVLIARRPSFLARSASPLRGSARRRSGGVGEAGELNERRRVSGDPS